jgi:hypothetical protein
MALQQHKSSRRGLKQQIITAVLEANEAAQAAGAQATTQDA